MENKTLFPIKDITELRQRAQEAYEPEEILHEFPSLHLKNGFRLEAFRYSCFDYGAGVVWAVPYSSTLQGSKEWKMIDFFYELPRPFPIEDSCLLDGTNPGDLKLPRPPGALDNVMEAIEGVGTPQSYLSASIFAREIAEFGAFWHSCVWSTHTILGEGLWTSHFDWGENEKIPPEQEWHWLDTKPSEWRPSVIRNDEVITVKFYTFSGLGVQAIYCYTDTYKPNNYKFEYDVKKIALGGGGYIF